MDACCEQKADEITTLRGKHKNVLVIVLIINAVFFVVEAAAGLLANSTALLADSLDMLGDSLVYGFSLYVLSRSAAWKAKGCPFERRHYGSIRRRCSPGSHLQDGIRHYSQRRDDGNHRSVGLVR
jgi:Co/Zn/Cd efflux system component